MKCLLCSSRESKRVVTGNHLCDGCFPKWVEMRKRSFKNLLATEGCTAYVDDNGAIIHLADCEVHK